MNAFVCECNMAIGSIFSDREWRRHLDQPIFVAFEAGARGMMGLRLSERGKWPHRARLVSVYVRKGERGTRGCGEHFA